MSSVSRSLQQGALLIGLFCFALPVFAQARKVDPQDLYRHWILLNTQVKMDAPNSGTNLDKPGCVAVTYTVGSDGVPRDVTVAKVVPHSDLGPMARSAVTNFRYGPALSNRIAEPIATYYVVPFNAPADKAQKQQLMDACQLPGYGK